MAKVTERLRESEEVEPVVPEEPVAALAEAPVEPAPVSEPEEAAPARPLVLTEELDFTKQRTKEKAGWYISAELMDRVRDAVAGLGKKGLRKGNGLKISAGDIVEPAIQRMLDELEEKHNGGRPWPTSAATKKARRR